MTNNSFNIAFPIATADIKGNHTGVLGYNTTVKISNNILSKQS
jgi:hypothetical protein